MTYFRYKWLKVYSTICACRTMNVRIKRNRSCTQSEILTFGCTELILTHDMLLSMPQVTPILTNMYIIHNNTHIGP